MVLKRPLVAAMALGVLLGLPLQAETSGPLTWDDCVRLAARQNPDLLAAAKSMAAGQAQYRGSWNGILPQVSLSNTYTKSERTSSVGAGGTSLSTQSEIYTAQGTASLDLINPGGWAAIRTASAQYEQSRAGLRSASSTVLLNLYKAFAATLFAQEQERVARDIQALWKTDADMIALRYDSGRESLGNKMKTDAELLQAEADLKQSGRDRRVAQASLSQALGESSFQALAVTGTWTSGRLPTEAPSIEAWIDRQPRVAVQEAVVRQARASVQSAGSSFFPNLSLSYSRGYQDNAEFPTNNPYWVFSGQLSYPLFGGGPTAAFQSVAAARRNVEKAEEDLRSLKNQIRSDVESAWANLTQAQDQVHVQAAFLEASRQRRKESDIRYQSGLMAFEEWQLVVIDLVNFEKSFLRSEENQLLAEAQWHYAVGRGLGEAL